MSKAPENLKYTKEHEWTLVESDLVLIGITDFAQSSLGDIVFMELPDIGRVLKQGESFGVVESIKSVSDLYAPISGEVVSVNTALVEKPENCNTEPYGSWMIKIKPSNKAELENLLTASSYLEFCNH